MPLTRNFSVGAILLLAGAATFAASVLPGPTFPSYETPTALTAACARDLDAGAAHVARLESAAADGGWLAAWDDLQARMEEGEGPMELLVNLHPSAPIRDAAQACVLRWSEFESALGQNATLYAAAQKVVPGDAIDGEYRRVLVEEFEDAGVGLPAAQRARAKQIGDRITEVGQQFAKRVREDGTKVPFTPDELDGVAESNWKEKPRDAEGRVLLGLDTPTYLAVLMGAEKAAGRERMWRAKVNEGGAENIVRLAELAQLRRERAALFGFKSFADFQLRRRMAENTVNTQRFLDEVKNAVGEREKRDLEELRVAKASHLGTPLESTRLERWDVAFYTERVRRARYSVDQAAFRPYFPPQASLQFVMKIAERLLGVRYERVPAQLWHHEAQAYAAIDVKTGKPLATLYVDLYPREGKYSHAAVWSFRHGATRIGRTPQAALVVNLDRQGLTLAELETLLHEMGHALHGNLSATRYVGQSGTGVQRDFVEAPSQMLQDWVYDKSVLKMLNEVCPTCKPVPDELIAKAKVAKDFGKGIAYARQHLYASYDLALHGADAPEPLALWARMEGATPLGTVPGTRFPAAFGHIASGYAAGYYGYLWSLVVALDLRTAFEGNRLDPVAGARYRETVLSQGRQAPPRELVRNFLGRETNSKAFFEDLNR